MGIADRKDRDRSERGQRIIAAARLIAEKEGWSAVTIRRLADEIEYSQPVLYSHFENRNAIVAAVAIAGFSEIAAALRQAAQGSSSARNRLEKVAMAYLAFAREQPAMYEAMFTMPTGLGFAETGSQPELRDAFSALAAAVIPAGGDVEIATETFWATLHGLAELERSDRIKPDARAERVALIVRGLLGC